MFRMERNREVVEGLVQVAQLGMDRVEADSIAPIATWVWSGRDLLDLGAIRGPYREQVLLLVDRLSNYAVVGEERHKAVQQLLRKECDVRTLDTRLFQVGYRRVLPYLQSYERKDSEARLAGLNPA